MPKSPETRNPRLLRRGDVVQLKGQEVSEVVRDVSIVLHLANGQDEVYHTTEEVTMGEIDDIDPTELAEVAAADAKLREGEMEALAEATGVERKPKPATGKAAK